MKTVKVVAAIICDNIKEKNKIFATARGYGELKGGWEFPGGKVEPGETPQQALVREIMEELDTEIKVGELVDTIEFDYPTFHLSMDCFWAEVTKGHLELKEAEAAKWLTKDQLDSVAWLPADVTLIDKIRRYMIYVTGDIHGDQILWDACISNFLKEGDNIIVLGDFGIGFFDGRYWPEEMFYDYLAEQKYTVLFIDGNHENFEKLNSFPVDQWHGGRVQFIRSNVIHLMRGEIYDIDGKKIFCFGGGYSLDKDYRVPGRTWWPQEMPDDGEYRNATKNLEECGFTVDYILTHTAPADTVEYMSRLNLGIKNSVVEEFPLTSYFQWIVETVRYDKWFFGHFHIDAEIWRNQYAVLDSIRELHTGELIKNRC